jgi:predicted anti-sigma-YlaC factor YlaD
MRRIIKNSIFLAGTIFIMFFACACSPSRLAMDMTIDALTGAGSSTVFSGDEDPQLIADALPFALKMYESLLQERPDHERLLSVTASGFVSYANAFCHLPASMNSSRDVQKRQLQRASGLYLRGRDWALRAIEVRNPGFLAYLQAKDFETALPLCGSEDVEDLYWAAAGWFGAISAGGFNMRMMLEIPSAYALLLRALSLNDSFQNGALNELLITILPASPKELLYRPAISPEEDQVRLYEKTYLKEQGIDTAFESPIAAALHHYQRAVIKSEGKLVGPHVACAEAVAVPLQDYELFSELLEKALTVDIDLSPESRLINTLQKEKAQWLLDHAEDLFIEIPIGGTE